ncbi:LacI family DNA-binding transcriptional regulator [uncultured Bifidobacterium sp.]|uniref:LacI family DNA-binding transcriptional regulator n=1 Tax=uncultured Bifidobacterium sp. TaxID=165187 RepID=UPI0026122E85|nr:LacI family DNA-binding transcriptional regulator [uncultured Bifidobacterium sp.]
MTRPANGSGKSGILTSHGRRRVTLADLAAKTGLSSATISRVLNGKSVVASDTRRTVLNALDELGYRRPPSAQPHSDGLVGVVLPDLDNPVYPQYLESIEIALSRHGYGSLLCSQRFSGSSESAMISRLIDYGVVAAIFIDGLHGDTTSDKSPYVRLHNSGARLVLINGFSSQIPGVFISLDNVSAMKSVVAHLSDLGHEDIGLVVGPMRYLDAERKKVAFLDVMKGHGLGTHARCVSSLSSVEGGQAAAIALIDQGCTAIVCSSASFALGALLASHSRGLRVPEDLSIVGFDDFAAAPYLDPALTTIRQPIIPMSSAAVSAIADSGFAEDAASAELMFQSSLIVRRSTAARSSG